MCFIKFKKCFDVSYPLTPPKVGCWVDKTRKKQNLNIKRKQQKVRNKTRTEDQIHENIIYAVYDYAALGWKPVTFDHESAVRRQPVKMLTLKHVDNF